MPVSNHRSTFVNIAVFIFLEVASLCLLSCGDGARQQWIGRFFTNIQAGLWGTADSIGEYFSLRAGNERLAQENFELRERIHKMEKAAVPADPGPRENFSFTSATIVTMTRGSQHNYMILDRGDADGIEKDDGIITDRGAIGIVQSVTEKFAYAISYANMNMSVSARIGRQGAVGTLRWDGRSTNRSVLSGIPLHCAMQKGDTVYTSGFSTIFPGGIPLGTILSTKEDNGNSSEVQVELFEDMSALKYVTIVRNLDREELKLLSGEGKQ